RVAGEAQLYLARETSAQAIEVQALRNLAQADRASGELRQARKRLSDAARISSARGDRLTWIEIHLDIARLDLDEGSYESAQRGALEAAVWLQARGLNHGEAVARAILAASLLPLGRRAEARESATQALAKVPESDRELRLSILPLLSQIEAVTGNPAKAEYTLARAVAEASQAGLAAVSMEARLAQGEVLLMNKKFSAGEALLLNLQREAREKGFGLIVQRARQAILKLASR
ncbi:MAG TPA: hypothetical protein VFR31_02400, partial [Thermoanaerobaculia bacterium]|nr:hypothetical protein [Thermoanaerobaculia bacterium]